MENKTVKNLIFKIEMDGMGTVNFDEPESRWNVKTYGNPSSIKPYNNDNIKIAKSEYRRIGVDDDNNPIYRRTLKISSECLRHSIFEKDYDVINGRIMKNDMLLASYISSPAALLRGYMFADKETIKSKSPITISAALETSGAIIIPEVGSVSGDKSDTSLFYTENTGMTKYEANGFISLKQLEFLSCDNFFERKAIKESWVDTKNGIFNIIFEQRYGRIPYSIGTYTSTANAFTKHIGERGLHFDEQFEKYLIIEFFKRLLSMDIKRSGSYAKVSKVMVKPVYDGLVDTYENPDGWMELSSDSIETFVNGLALHSFYEKCDNDADSMMDELKTIEKQKKSATETQEK